MTPGSKQVICKNYYFPAFCFLSLLFLTLNCRARQEAPVFYRSPDAVSDLNRFEKEAKELEAWMARYYRAGAFPSFAVGIVQGSNLVYEHYINSGPEKKYGIASVTKTLTATGMQRLIEKGVVDPQMPVRDFFPEVKLERFGDEPLRINHLLTHSGGLPDLRYYHVPDYIRPDEVDFIVHRPIYPPGKHYRYSNENFLLAGAVIEKATGMPLEEAMRVLVFDPVGMKNTKPGKTGAGGVRTTLSDLAKFASLWLNEGVNQEGKRLLSRQSIRDMMKQPIYIPAGKSRFYTGRAWRIRIDEEGIVTFFHIGGADYISAWIQMFPKYNMAIVYLGNPPEYTPTVEGYLAALQIRLGNLATTYAGAPKPLYEWKSDPVPGWIYSQTAGEYKNILTGRKVRITEAKPGIRIHEYRSHYLIPVTTHIFRGGPNYLTHDFIVDPVTKRIVAMANGSGYYEKVMPNADEETAQPAAE